MMTTTQTWRALLRDLLERGEPTAQTSIGAEWRGSTSYELLAYRTEWPMDRAVVLCPARKIGFRFLAAEAAFILSGSNRLTEIVPYARNIVGMSDDGEFLAGAYGPRFIDELPYVVSVLAQDAATRQAVSMVWRPRPRQSKDIPCTLTLQWLIRSDETGAPTLHCIANMRSSDAWMGIPYDVHVFSMCSAYLALLLRDRLGPLKLGTLYLTAASQHLYRLDRENAKSCVWSNYTDEAASTPIERDDELFDLAPINLDEFPRADDLTQHLWAVARRDRGGLRGSWLKETLQ